MSEGPIKQWRDGFKVPPVSTPNSRRICGARTLTSTYCGRIYKRGRMTTNWDDVTCADCIAARRADAHQSREQEPSC